MTKRIPASELRAVMEKALRKPRVDREGPIHIACLNYLRFVLPGAEINHSPNELDLGGDRRSKAIAQAKAKAKGMAPGWPDIEVLWRGKFWCFEVKAPGGKPTQEQIERGAGIVRNGGRWAVVTSVDDVRRCVSLWMAQDDAEAVSVPITGVIT